MRPVRSTILLLALLLANASAVLFFRYFITVDGPIHVLHASLLEAPWTTADHLAQGVTYDRTATHSWLGDRILMLLLLFRSPEQAHDLYAALVSCAVVLAVVAYLRAHGTRMGPAILWLIPAAFNILLIMGLFHFLLGIAVAFGSVAWWKWRENSPLSRWAGLLIGAILAWYTHRGAPIVLGMLFLPTLLIGLREQGTGPIKVERRYLIWVMGVCVVLAVAIASRGWPILQRIPQRFAIEPPVFKEALPLRPVFLLDRQGEEWLIHGIGALLLLSFSVGIWARWRMGRNVYWHDTLLALLFLFTLISSIYHAPMLRELFIAERCRWLAFLSLALWLAAIADEHRGWIARVIGGAAVCALPLHGVRLLRAEESCSRPHQVHMAAMEATDALGSSSLVLPVMADPDRLLQHLEAYVAIRHDGILFAPDEHVTLVLPTEMRRHASWLYSEDPSKLVRHWRKGLPREIDEVLFMGSGIERTVNQHPWPSLLGAGYRLSFDNGYARIYTAVRDSKPSAVHEGAP